MKFRSEAQIRQMNRDVRRETDIIPRGKLTVLAVSTSIFLVAVAGWLSLLRG